MAGIYPNAPGDVVVAIAIVLLTSSLPSAAGWSEVAPADTPPASPRTRLVVLDMAANGVDRELVKTITDSVAVTVQTERIVDDVMSAADLRAMMNVEANKQVLGANCDVDTSCLAEVAEALGADVLMHGSVGRFGDVYAVTLSIFDARASRAIAREKTEAPNLELLSKRITYISKRLALAYQGKDIALAGAEPTASSFQELMRWAGIGATAVGIVVGTVGVVWTASNASTLEDPKSAGSSKTTAYATYPSAVATAATGFAVAVTGAALLAGSLVVE